MFVTPVASLPIELAPDQWPLANHHDFTALYEPTAKLFKQAVQCDTSYHPTRCWKILYVQIFNMLSKTTGNISLWTGRNRAD
jgi:hypothetical protein